MPNQLSSPYLNLSFHPERGEFDFFPAAAGYPSLSGCRMRIELQQYSRKQIFPLDSWEETGESTSMGSSPHGPLVQAVMLQNFQKIGIKARITFALALDYPLFLWKIQLQNVSGEPMWLNRIEFLRAGGQVTHGKLDFPVNPDATRLSFFSNGWQSWSHTGDYRQQDRMRISRLGLLQQPMVANSSTPLIRLPGYFTADFFGAVSDLNTGTGIVAGFLSQKQHFGTIEAVLYDRPSLTLYTGDQCLLEPGAEVETDWAVITPFQTRQPDPLGTYIEAVAREHRLSDMADQPPPAGWCSWYQYYTGVKAGDVQSNLQTMIATQRQLPLDLVQIDDGFQTRIGDWFSFKESFPGGVAPLANEISSQGFTPGLWLAPFILDRRSKFYRDHPQFILRSRRGNPINAGFGWNNLTAAVDLTVPGALEETCRAVHTAVSEWGFPYLKLDFLYAAALPGERHEPTRTRAQIMRMGMQALRDAAGPQAYLLGCGLPLGSGIGLVDAMRISADVNAAWEPQFHRIKAPFNQEPHMPSARNAIQNILTRAPLHNRWWVNDPDCLLLRPDTQLTEVEVQTLVTAIGFSGGSLLLSDDLSRLPPERRWMAQVLLPLLNKRPEVLDLLEEPTPRRLRLCFSGPDGDWTVAARFNWQDQAEAWTFQPVDFNLPDESYLVSSFWNQDLYTYRPGSTLSMPEISPHGCALLAIYTKKPASKPAYVGSDLHFTQGSELKEWRETKNHLRLTLSLGRDASGFIRLQLPHPPARAEWDGIPAAWRIESENIFRFEVSLENQASLVIDYAQ